MPDKAKKCRHCQEPIPATATVCAHCKKSQVAWMAWLESHAPLISIIPIIVSVILVGLSLMQFFETREQRRSAGRALEQAEAARRDAQNANVETQKAKGAAEQASTEARKSVEHLRANIKLLLEMDSMTTNLVDESSDTVGAKRVRGRLEEFAVPNEKERKEWLESLKKQRAR